MSSPSWRARLVNLALRFLVRRRFDVSKTPEYLRAQTAKRFGRIKPKIPDAVRIADDSLGGVPAPRFEYGSMRTDKVLLYLHGGGFFEAALPLHTEYVSLLCERLQCDAFMPDYRLAPEHPFPAAPEDSLACYEELLQRGYQANNIVIAGDSAGGNLSLVTLMSARDKGLQLPAAAVMLSPVTDACFTGDSIYNNAGKDPLFNLPILFWMRQLYLGKHSPADVRVSPYYNEFTGLPPLAFHVGSTELILDSSLLAAEKAKQAGVSVQLTVWPEMPHVFPLLAVLPEARAATDEVVSFVQQAWA